jgi:predicted N-formylglutamate amidohydrolase
VERAVRDGIDASGSVLHLGVHSFVPVLGNRVREVDVGILYDPGRQPEKTIARAWLKAARKRLPGLRILANRPYRGVSDGLTTALRRTLPEARYSGPELEVGQALLGAGEAGPLAEAFAEALREAVGR